MRDRKEIEAEKLANTIHDTFASAYALDEKVDPEWLKNVTKQALKQTAEKARVEAIRDVKSVGRRASGGYPPTQQGKIQRSRAFGFNEGASAALEALKANPTKN